MAFRQISSKRGIIDSVYECLKRFTLNYTSKDESQMRMNTDLSGYFQLLSIAPRNSRAD